MKTPIPIITVATVLACACCSAAFAAELASKSLIEVDHRSLVSRSDLIYLAPAEHIREGQPIGNGRMGTVVWTTPGAVHFLINRVDQYSADNSHGGEFCGPSDDFGRLARVSVEVGGEPFAPAKDFLQRLSLYDAECTIRGQGVAVRCFISSERDVLALEIDDLRAAPPPLKVTVTAVRPLETRTGEHLARVEFPAVGEDIALLQRFDEKDCRLPEWDPEGPGRGDGRRAGPATGRGLSDRLPLATARRPVRRQRRVRNPRLRPRPVRGGTSIPAPIPARAPRALRQDKGKATNHVLQPW